MEKVSSSARSGNAAAATTKQIGAFKVRREAVFIHFIWQFYLHLDDNRFTRRYNQKSCIVRTRAKKISRRQWTRRLIFQTQISSWSSMRRCHHNRMIYRRINLRSKERKSFHPVWEAVLKASSRSHRRDGLWKRCDIRLAEHHLNANFKQRNFSRRWAL